MASKSKLNLYCQKIHIPVPCYSTKRVSEGFVSTVTVAERTHKSQNAHSTKKAAEDDAANIALQLIVQSHTEVTNVDQLIDSKTATKKCSSWQYLSPNATQVNPPLPFSQHVTQPVGPNEQQLSPGMIDRPNHNQLHSLSQSPISCMQSSAPTQPVYSPTQPACPSTQPVYPPTHIQHHWDNRTENKGKPSTTIPASPNHMHGVPGSITPSAPAGQSRLGSLQNSPSPAFSAPSPSVNPSTTFPSRMTSQEALEAFCRLRGLSPPKYHIVQNIKDRYTAKVTVGNSELSTEREYEDFDTAKESATALAVIQLGLETLALSNSGNPKPTTLQQQAHPFRQPLQQTFPASQFTNTTPHHPQQKLLAATSVHTAGSLPLHPPSFYQTSLQSQTPSVDSSQSQPPKTGSFPQPTLPQAPSPLSPHPSFPSPLHPNTRSSQPTTTTVPATPACGTVQSPAILPTTPAMVKSPETLLATPVRATVQVPAIQPTTPARATVQSPATLPATPVSATVQIPATLPTTPARATFQSPATLPTTPAYASPATLPTTPARVLQSRGGGAQQQSNNVLAPGQYKQILNLYCQKKHINLPSYSYEYPEDSVGYIASVTVGGETFTSPPKSSKKIAESIAAAEAVKEMGIMQEQSSAPFSDGECRQVPMASQAGASSGTISFKNLLQEYTQKLKVSLPHYTTEWTAMGFKSTVSVQRPSKETVIFTGGEQSVKKAAEQDAARIACTKLNLLGS